MTKRLLLLCQMIPMDGIGFADVGTDHGYIPVWLALNGYNGNIYASDISEDPLRKAISLAKENRLEERISFSLCDGMDACPPEKLDCILIAGMGGDTICRILDRAEWILDGGYTLILQPMTHAEVVRYWLIHNGFRITREAVVSEDHHVYQIFSAATGKSGKVSDAEYCAGITDADRMGENVQLVYQDLIPRFRQKLNGLREAGQADSCTFRFYSGIVQELKERIEKADTDSAETG